MSAPSPRQSPQTSPKTFVVTFKVTIDDNPSITYRHVQCRMMHLTEWESGQRALENVGLDPKKITCISARQED